MRCVMSKISQKIRIEVAMGIILISFCIVGGLAWLMNKNLSENSKINEERNNQMLSSLINQKRNARVLFATNGTKDVYKILKDGKWIVVFDGKESEAYEFVGAPAFSPDGTQFAFSARLNGQTLLVINNNPQVKNYDSISAIVFNPNGETIAYVASKDEKYVVVVNGKEGKTYQDIDALQTATGVAYIIFSYDGQKIAYKAVEDQKVFVVVNGQEGKRYDEITNFSFSADGQFTYQAQDGDRQVTVVNNKEIASNQNSSNNTANTSNNTSSSDDDNYGLFTGDDGKDVYLDQGKLRKAICPSGSSGEKNCNF